MDTIQFRQTLAAFLGPERFRRFVHQLNRRNRLRAWQEDVVTSLVAAHPEFGPLGCDELLRVLAICEVHGGELQSYHVRVFRGNVDYSSEYEQAWVHYFPNTKREMWSTEGSDQPASPFIELRYCSACCDAEREWVRNRNS